MSGAAEALARMRAGQVFYGWYIVAAGALSSAVVLGVTTYGIGVFYEPMRQELGWSMALLAAGVSVRTFETGFLSPFTGFLVDRLGPRKMAISGTLILCAGLVLLAQVHDLWLYFAASMLIALGQSLGAFTAFSAAVMRWFQKKRGRALGFMTFGNGMGYLAVPVLSLGIVAFDWRTTLMIAAAVIFVVILPVCLVLRPSPEPYGYLPDGERPAPAPPPTAGAAPSPARAASADNGMTVAEALRTPAFYLLIMASGLGGSTLSTWIALQVPHYMNAGFSAETAGLIVGAYGLTQAVMRAASGWLGDILGRRRMLIASYLLVSVGFVIFAGVTSERWWLLPVYWVVFGIGHASFVALSQAIVADYFGTLRFATIRGLVQTLSLPAGVALPVGSGWIFDQTGSYVLVFVMLGALAATGSLWLLLIRRPVWNVVHQSRLETALPEKVGGRA